jgi:predicted RNase H-like HicB family nuclease
VTYGETLDEAREKAREAIELCLEVMEEEGQPIPPPDRDPRRAVDELVSVAISRG